MPNASAFCSDFRILQFSKIITGLENIFQKLKLHEFSFDFLFNVCGKKDVLLN